MTYEQFEAEWEAKIEAAAQAVVDGTGTEAELEALMIASGEAFADFTPTTEAEEGFAL